MVYKLQCFISIPCLGSANTYTIIFWVFTTKLWVRFANVSVKQLSPFDSLYLEQNGALSLL